MAYIDTDILSADFIQQHTSNADVFLAVRKILDSIPAADVVVVTRCKDCKHYREGTELCMLHFSTVDADAFCSYGERKST